MDLKINLVRRRQIRLQLLVWTVHIVTHFGVYGQFKVNIVSSPAGTPVSGSTNTFDYPILSSVTLTCNVTSNDTSSFTVTSYQWNTIGCYTHPDFNNGNPACFSHGQTTQNVTGNNLNAEDAGTITCTVTISDSDYTSEQFTLRISGVALTGVRYNHDNNTIISTNALSNYSYINASDDITSGIQIARCVTGLGPNDTQDNSALGGLHFHDSTLPIVQCDDSSSPIVRQQPAGLNTLGVISMFQCRDISTAYEGIYTCVMMNSSMMNESISFGVYFTERTAPVIDTPSSSTVTITIGSSLTLSCTSRGSPPDTFTWRKDNDPTVLQSTSITAVDYTSTNAVFRADYSIDSVTTSDNGTYTCTVTNPIGSDSTTITVVVVFTPAVNITPSNTQTVGQSLTLQCEVTTMRGITSRVDIVWSSNGTELERMNNVSSTTVDNSLLYTDSYTISQLSTDDEGRNYQCEAVIHSSPTITNNASVTLDVTVPQALIIASQSEEGSVSGLNHTLYCTVTLVNGVSSSLVMVNWDREDSASLLSSDNKTVDNGLQFTRTISFIPLLNANSGQYTCSVLVTGFSEADNSDSLMIMVNAPNLTVTLTPPVINGSAADVSINLTCTATVEESIILDEYQFVWMFNGIAIDQSDGWINITNVESIPMPGKMQSILFIGSNDYTFEDNGRYTCQVSLTVATVDIFQASDTSIVSLRAISPPLKPNITNLIRTPYSVNISWIVTIIVYDAETYTVHYGTDSMTLVDNIVIMGNTDLSAINEVFTVNISALTPFTKYYYIVSASNSVGTTNTSVMTFMTNETAPSTAPHNFRSIIITATSITFRWDNITISEANGIVRGFIITCTNDDSPLVMATVDSTMATVSMLSPFTEYTCTISALTVLSGPKSDPVTVVTAQSASDPPIINTIITINNSTVRVTWTRPTMPNGNITSYTIRYVTDSNGRSVNVPYNGDQTQSYDITGLSPYQLVTVTITATNGGGTSDLSDAVSGRSSEGVPGVVDILEIAQGDIKWRPPSQPNGIITGYQVIYFVYQIPSTKIMSDVLDNTITEFSIENSTPGVPYEVVVVAFTSVGKGAENDYIIFFSEELTPTRSPENVVFNQLNSTALNITWTPLTLFETRGFPEYRVVLTATDTNSHRKRQSNSVSIITTNSFAIFTDLNENTDYSVVVGVRTGNMSIFVEGSPIDVPTISPPNNGNISDNNDNSTVFAVLLMLALAVIVLLAIVTIYIIGSKKKTNSYSPRIADNNYDVAELQAKHEPNPQPVENDTSFMENKDENMQKNPAYQTAN